MSEVPVAAPTPIVDDTRPAAFWPRGWWRLVDYKIGIVPAPVLLLLLVVIWGFAATGKLPSDILMAVALLSVGGFTCAEIGKRLPILRNIGAPAILATFIPSALVFYHLLPAPVIALERTNQPLD